ncbi:hypothetical protein M5X66_15250 [Providencia sp. PROV188]|uniref:hypothetical protein n=1 Tax=Providencia TaxID=586 RepID=UPI0003E20035|nr:MULTISPECIES: hypothetical protein [Providencia]ETS98321.1 hypothetical protein HMPREF1568_2024 [Providencia alcalifaciens PAL-3]EUC97782.1 hypothetical protein HMPREF1566_1176 [Providencia alcalifaciens PAL-1]MTB45555.1 hypothetical protein [Providencia sp. wls1950]MTC22903.1 hypothetical protein [Providencia sp. wls1938]MTC42207.1 hypothetical protein [Providencia sp. wls1921]
MNIATRLRYEGYKKGFAQGFVEGFEEEFTVGLQTALKVGKAICQQEITLNALQLGLNIETISKITELSLSEIQALMDRPSTIASCEAKRLSLINAAD